MLDHGVAATVLGGIERCVGASIRSPGRCAVFGLVQATPTLTV